MLIVAQHRDSLTKQVISQYDEHAMSGSFFVAPFRTGGRDEQHRGERAVAIR